MAESLSLQAKLSIPKLTARDCQVAPAKFCWPGRKPRQTGNKPAHPRLSQLADQVKNVGVLPLFCRMLQTHVPGHPKSTLCVSAGCFMQPECESTSPFSTKVSNLSRMFLWRLSTCCKMRREAREMRKRLALRVGLCLCLAPQRVVEIPFGR